MADSSINVHNKKVKKKIPLQQTLMKRAKYIYKLKLNSVALVREQTIPTERPLPVGEVSAYFCG